MAQHTKDTDPNMSHGSGSVEYEPTRRSDAVKMASRVTGKKEEE